MRLTVITLLCLSAALYGAGWWDRWGGVTEYSIFDSLARLVCVVAIVLAIGKVVLG